MKRLEEVTRMAHIHTFITTELETNVRKTNKCLLLAPKNKEKKLCSPLLFGINFD